VSRIITTAALGGLLAVALPGGAASAHNSFDSSDPADGATLDAPPSQISIVFEDSVPLDTASATVIDADGSRTEVDTVVHGPSGDNEILVALPPLSAGEATVRWKLVSSDGHVISERIEFTITAPAASTTDPGTTGPGSTDAPPVTDTTTAPIVADPSELTSDTASEAGSTSDAVRWLLRYASYLAVLAVIAVAASTTVIWPEASADPQLRRISSVSLASVAALALVQLLVLAADTDGGSVISAWGAIDDALRTDAGIGLAVRIVAAGGAWIVAHQMTLSQRQVRDAAVGIGGVLLLGTWAWAGHARSQRWPELGVVLDVIHHGAAGVWVGGLAIVGFVAARRLAATDLVRVVVRLSSTAAAAVVALIVTGGLQTVRLSGGPGGLLDGRHGVLILVKVVIVAVMLVLARANRTRVGGLSGTDGQATEATLADVRRAVVVEVVLGLTALAVTASLVVAVPATA
jgi:copper transport protein